MLYDSCAASVSSARMQLASLVLGSELLPLLSNRHRKTPGLAAYTCCCVCLLCFPVSGVISFWLRIAGAWRLVNKYLQNMRRAQGGVPAKKGESTHPSTQSTSKQVHSISLVMGLMFAAAWLVGWLSFANSVVLAVRCYSCSVDCRPTCHSSSTVSPEFITVRLVCRLWFVWPEMLATVPVTLHCAKCMLYTLNPQPYGVCKQMAAELSQGSSQHTVSVTQCHSAIGCMVVCYCHF